MTNKTNTDIPPQEARERLLNSALLLFIQRGYAASTVREICQAAGVTKPVLYYYFKSKEGLYLQLMEDTSTQFESTVAELSSFPGSSRQRVIHFCHGVFDLSIQQLSLVKLMYSIYYGAPQGAPFYDMEQYYDRILLIITGLIEEGIERGELKTGNTRDMVWAALACMNITIEEQLCHCTPRIDRDAMTRMLEIVFDGMAAR